MELGIRFQLEQLTRHLKQRPCIFYKSCYWFIKPNSNMCGTWIQQVDMMSWTIDPTLKYRVWWKIPCPNVFCIRDTIIKKSNPFESRNPSLQGIFIAIMCRMLKVICNGHIGRVVSTRLHERIINLKSFETIFNLVLIDQANQLIFIRRINGSDALFSG